MPLGKFKIIMETLLSKKVYTVSELTYTIKNLLESKFSLISVKGEISNLREQSSGHIYFSLKDTSAQLSAVLFRGNAAKLAKKPKEGDQVILVGEMSVYLPRGGYQLIVREVHFLGLGELLLKLHQLKEELKTAGYFDPQRKKKLPSLPKRIGVVTSPTGAVIQDIINVLKRRHPGFQLVLNPVKVQGEGAAEEIAQAIADFNKYDLADVLIVGRGGGSLEDLWAFNEKIVAKAIFDSKIPIISAVGHETDTSIADFVADLRAPTPSAAAEIVILERETLVKEIKTKQVQILSALKAQIQGLKKELGAFQKQPLLTNPYLLLSATEQRLDEIRSALDVNIKNTLEQNKNLLLACMKQSRALSPQNKLILLKQKLESLKNHLNSIDPNNLLKKGYSILFSQKDGSTILSTEKLAKGTDFYALLSDGKILAKSEGVYHGKK